MKSTDAEYSVDPLFKKTSAEFDEGGADGLLLNNLASAMDGRIILDSSDGLARAANQGSADAPAVSAQISLARLRGTQSRSHGARPIPSAFGLTPRGAHAPTERFMPALRTIWDREVCPSFRTFEFNPRDGKALGTRRPSRAQGRGVHAGREVVTDRQHDRINQVTDPAGPPPLPSLALPPPSLSQRCRRCSRWCRCCQTRTTTTT